MQGMVALTIAINTYRLLEAVSDIIKDHRHKTVGFSRVLEEEDDSDPDA